MKHREIRLGHFINPVFKKIVASQKTHLVLKGGRSSFKSSVISLLLVLMFLQDNNGNILCLRKVGKYLSTSVYEQIKWATVMLGVQDRFIFGKQPLKITDKYTGTAFYFFGVDDPQKLKSAKIAKGHVMALWFEELAEFGGVEDIDIIEDTFLRENIEGKEVKVFFSYNPPRNPYSWINEWAKEKETDSEYIVHHSTYLDDRKGFLAPQLLRKIENYKAKDPDYYRWMYLGEIIGMGDNVYNMGLFNKIESMDDLINNRLIGLAYATDTGHQISATTCLCLGITSTKDVVLLDTYYYSPAGRVVKKAPSELAKDLHAFVTRTSKKYPARIIRRTIDSAEGGLRNQYFLDYQITWNAVAKLAKGDMIDIVHDLLAQGSFFYLASKNNEIFIQEHQKYEWKPESLKTAKPDVIKENDHTCDAFQYFALDNAPFLGLSTRR